MEAAKAEPRMFLAALGELEAQAERAGETLRLLERLEMLVAGVEAAAQSGAVDVSRHRSRAERLLEALAADDFEAALEEAAALCRGVVAEYARRRLGASVEAGGCPHPDTVKAIEAMLRAAGPMEPLVRAALAAGADSVEKLVYNAGLLARSWGRLSQSLSRIHRSLARLEKSVGLDRGKMTAWLAARLSEAAGAADALALLEAAEKLLYTASAVASEAAERLVEATEAQRRCGAWRARLPCRLLDRAAAALAAARSELEALDRASSLEDAEARVRAAEARLRDARRSLEALRRLYKAFTGRPADGGLEALVEPLLEQLHRHAVTMEEEQVLEILVDRGTVDVMELHESNPRLSRAALRLCTRRIAHCTVSL